MLDSKTQKSFLDGKLEIPLVDCELRQCGSNSPTIYKGPAVLGQDEQGGLILRFFGLEHPQNAMMTSLMSELRYQPGVLIPETDYYDFVGYDPHRNPWHARGLSGDWSFGASVYVKLNVRTIEKTQENITKRKRRSSSVDAYVPGSFDLPWHGLTRSDTGSNVDLFETNQGAFKWKVRNVGDGLRISFHVENGDVEPHYRRFLIALAMVAGKSVDPTLANIADQEGGFSTQLHTQRRPLWTSKLLRPLPRHGSHVSVEEASSAHDFIHAFLTSIDRIHPEPCDLTNHVYGLWHRILRAGEHDVANSSLVLSVAIEALLHGAFKSEVDIDEGFLQEVGHAQAMLTKIDLKDRARARIVASLDGATNPNARDILYRLVKQGFIEQTHVVAWKKLRNAAAHGEDLGNHENLQVNLDLYHRCLGLFYRLIFIVIGYRGAYVDYSTRHWPDTKFG